MSYNNHITQTLAVFGRKYRNQGLPFVGYFTGRKPYLMALDPHSIKEVLITNFAYFNDNEVGAMMSQTSERFISQNPFFLCSPEWKEVRKELVPGYTSNRIRSYYPIVRTVCASLKTAIQRKCQENPVVDFDDIGGRFTNDVVCDVIFGIKANTLAEEDSLVLRMGSDFLKEFQKIGKFFNTNGLLPWWKRVYKYRMMEDSTSEFFRGLVQQSIEQRERGGNRDDYMQFLYSLKEKKGASVDRLTSHAMTFYLDGYDTSGIAMARIMMEVKYLIM